MSGKEHDEEGERKEDKEEVYYYGGENEGEGRSRWVKDKGEESKETWELGGADNNKLLGS